MLFDDTVDRTALPAPARGTLGTEVASMAERDVGIGNQLVGSVVVGVPDAVAHCLNLSQPTSPLPSSLVSPSRILKS